MNTRKDNHGVALAKWKATKPGHIAHPLRLIGERTNTHDLKTGQLIASAQYRRASSAARRGDGLTVATMARAFL